MIKLFYIFSCITEIESQVSISRLFSGKASNGLKVVVAVENVRSDFKKNGSSHEIAHRSSFATWPVLKQPLGPHTY